MAMVPHERSLVEKYKDKPFALIGVNFDNSKEEMRKVQEANKINWRSFYDGQEGPIGKKWAIQFLPTIYVIDHKGIIRYKNVRGDEMDKGIETLVKEAVADKK